MSAFWVGTPDTEVNVDLGRGRRMTIVLTPEDTVRVMLMGPKCGELHVLPHAVNHVELIATGPGNHHDVGLPLGAAQLGPLLGQLDQPTTRRGPTRRTAGACPLLPRRAASRSSAASVPTRQQHREPRAVQPRHQGIGEHALAASRGADEQDVLLGDQGGQHEVDLLIPFNQAGSEFLASGCEFVVRGHHRSGSKG